MTRLLLLASAAILLGGCASGGAQGATPGEAFTLAPGEEVTLPDKATLRYVRIVQDSRCPPGVQCIRAGDADVSFEFTDASGATAPVNLNLPESPQATLGNWRAQLLSLEFGDGAHATLRVDAAP